MIAVLHNIRSVHNVGSIFRTADAAGIEKIYLCGITPAPIDKYGRARRDFAKVSLGAEKTVEWEQVKSTARLIDRLKKPARQSPDSSRCLADGEKYKILAVEQNKKSIPYYKIPESYILNYKSCLVFGNEVRGLPQSILKRADKILEIPMKNVMVRQTHHPRHSGRGKESLNVSVAFGIVIFHLINA